MSGEKIFERRCLQDYEIRLTLSNMGVNHRLTDKNQDENRKVISHEKKLHLELEFLKSNPNSQTYSLILCKSVRCLGCTAERPETLKKKLSQFKLANTYERLHGAVHHIAVGC